MTIMFKCPGCGKLYQTADANAGMQNKCACGTVCLIPRAAAAAPPPAAFPAPPARPAPPAAPMARHAVPPPLPPGAFASPAPASTPMARPAGFGGYADAPPLAPGPRRSKKRLLVMGGAALGVFVLVGLGWVLWRVWFSPASLKDDYQYLPSDCAVIFTIKVDEIMASDIYKKVLELPDVKKKIDEVAEEEPGMAPNNLLRVTVGLDPKNPDEFIVVARTKKAVTVGDLRSGKKEKENKKNIKYNEVKVGKYTIYEQTYEYDFMPGKTQTGEAFCLINSKLVLGGKTDGLRKVLERSKKPEFTEGMQHALEQTNFSKPIAVAVNLKPLKENKDIVNAARGFGMPAINNLVDNSEAVGLDIGLTAEVEVNANVLFKDHESAESAKNAVSLIKEFIPKNALPQEAVDLLNAIKFSVDGSKVKANLNFKPDPFLKLARDQMKQ